MPRNVDPGTIKIGKGLAPEGTVEDNSLRYPERDVDPLRVHLHDPSRAHMAETIGIKDEGDCYVSDEVEGALQEICGGASAGRLNGLVSGGLFTETTTPNGTGAVTTNSLTLENPTEIMLGAGVYDASGLVADLSGLAANTYYVYFDSNSASPTFRTLVVSLTAPEVETSAGIEDVLLAKIAYDGADVTSWQDGRFFVRNLDRKVQYSSREGENVDAWSEGCFATLSAFLLWMAEYGGAGTGEEQKGEVLIRGSHNIITPLVIPSDNLQFVGDGNASITSKVFTGSEYVDISGRSGILFRNITFRCGSPNLTAIKASGTTLSDIVVEECNFLTSTQVFENCITLEHTGSGGEVVRIRSCKMQVENGVGIKIDGIRDVVIENCDIQGPNAASPTKGINIGAAALLNSFIRIEGCAISDLDSAVVVNNTKDLEITGCKVEDVKTGIDSSFGTGGTIVPANFYIHGNNITLDDTQGLVAVSLVEVPSSKISNNTLLCQRTSFGGALTAGISYTTVPGLGGPGLQGISSDLIISDNVIEGFFDRTAFTGSAIKLRGDAAGNNPLRDVKVTGNTTRESGISSFDEMSEFLISGNILDGHFPGNVNPGYGIQLASTAVGKPNRGVVISNLLKRFGSGIVLLGTEASGRPTDIRISDNYLTQIVKTQDQRADTFVGIGSKAIGLDFCENIQISDNSVSTMGTALDNSDTPIPLVGNCWPIAVYCRNSSQIDMIGNSLSRIESRGTGVSTGIMSAVGAGITSPFKMTGYRISDNDITFDDGNADSFAGVYFNLGDHLTVHQSKELFITNNRIHGRVDPGSTNDLLNGILFDGQEIATGIVKGSSYSNVEVGNNFISLVKETGIYYRGPLSANAVVSNFFTEASIRGNTVQAAEGASQFGVKLQSQSTAALQSFITKVDISENKFTIDKTTASSHCVLVDHTTPLGGLPCTTNVLNISDNVMDASGNVTGISINRIGIANESDRATWSISRNRIGVVSDATNGSEMTAGISVDLGQSGMKDFSILDNSISCRVTHPGIRVVGDGTNVEAVHLDWNFSRNSIELKGGVASANIGGMELNCTDSSIVGLQCKDNVIPCVNIDVDVGAFLIRFENTTGSALSFGEVVVSDNRVNTGQIRFDLQSMNSYNVIVSDNIVEGEEGPFVMSTAILPSPGCVQVYGIKRVAVPSAKGWTISGNQLFKLGGGVYVSFLNHSVQQGISITGNTTASGKDSTSGAFNMRSYGVEFEIQGNDEEQEVENLSITDNTIMDCESYGIVYRSLLPNQSNLVGHCISRNRITGKFDTPHTPTSSGVRWPIYVVLSGVGRTFLRGLNVDSNIINPNVPNYGEFPIKGINIEGPESIEDHVIESVSVSGNQVNLRGFTGYDNTGIQVKFKQLDSDPYTVKDLCLDRNVIAYQRTIAETPANVGMILVNMTCSYKGASISGNSIVYSGSNNVVGQFTKQFDYGIRLFHEFQIGESIQNASVIADVINPRYLVGEVGQTSWDYSASEEDGTPNGVSREFTPVTWVNTRISNNSVHFPAGRDLPAANQLYQDDNAAMSICSTMLAGGVDGDFITVTTYSMTITDNILRPGRQHNELNTIEDSTELVGFFTRILDHRTAWPNGGIIGSQCQQVYEGWVITGNSAADFCRKDETGGIWYGFDVRVASRDMPVAYGPGAFYSVCSSNYAQDNGSGDANLEAGAPDGWDRFQPTTVQLNILQDPRTF